MLNQINPGSTDFQVKVLLANPGLRLRPGMVVQGLIATVPVTGVRVPVTAFTDDNHDALMVVQPDKTVKTVQVAEIGTDGTTSIVTGLAAGRASSATAKRASATARRFAPAVKFSLTRLFITRPTLVFVLIALMTFAGVISTATIVKQLFPNVEQPTVTISVQYNGASVTEMRDNIVAPIEQNLAGTPDLQTINSVVQQGQATITAIFDDHLRHRDRSRADAIKPSKSAEKILPTNITPPTVQSRDPTQSVVVTLAIYSQKLSLARALALRAERHRAATSSNSPASRLRTSAAS